MLFEFGDIYVEFDKFVFVCMGFNYLKLVFVIEMLFEWSVGIVVVFYLYFDLVF